MGAFLRLLQTRTDAGFVAGWPKTAKTNATSVSSANRKKSETIRTRKVSMDTSAGCKVRNFREAPSITHACAHNYQQLGNQLDGHCWRVYQPLIDISDRET